MQFAGCFLTWWVAWQSCGKSASRRSSRAHRRRSSALWASLRDRLHPRWFVGVFPLTGVVTLWESRCVGGMKGFYLHNSESNARRAVPRSSIPNLQLHQRKDGKNTRQNPRKSANSFSHNAHARQTRKHDDSRITRWCTKRSRTSRTPPCPSFSAFARPFSCAWEGTQRMSTRERTAEPRKQNSCRRQPEATAKGRKAHRISRTAS